MATATTERTSDRADERTKPPFLRRARIQGYKSIALCDVSLQPMTILVGRNGSGKSNFLDALAFLRDAVKFDLPEALKRHGGLPSILCRSAPGDGFTVAVEVGFFTSSGAEWEARYSLTVPASEGRSLGPHQERLFVRDATTNQETGFHLAGGKLHWFGSDVNLGARQGAPGPTGHFPLRFGLPPDSSATIDLEALPLPSGHLVLGMVGHAPAVALAEGLASMGAYNFNPDAIRRLQKPLPGVLLDRDGGNLASVIAGLEEVDPDSLLRVRDYLATIAEDVEDLHAKLYGEYETIRFRMRSPSSKAPLELDAASMSDGTLRALAALMAAFQVHEPTGPPSVIGIEEPETSLHPGGARALVDALQEATGRTQVLLTTHSGDLLADRAINPSHLLVVRNRNGQTQIAPIDGAGREIIRKELYTLADLQRMNQLEPDLTDLARQANSKSSDGEE